MATAISCNNKTYHLGYFTNELAAAKAYDKAARKYHGDFAALNFPNHGLTQTVDFTN